MPLTAERRERAFKEALTFEEFVNAMQVNQKTFLDNYNAYRLSEEAKAFFASLEEPVDVLVLAHDWCGDVVANTPLFGRIQNETGKLRLHLLLRDPDNVDIAALYPHPDGYNHIPTYIFFNQQGQELGVFIERPAEITALMAGWRKDFFDAHPEFEGRDLPLGQMSEEVKKAYLQNNREQRQKVRELEQSAIFEVIKPILSQPAVAMR